MDNSNGSASPRIPFDPGWNDPPTVAYNSHTPNRPRNFLNKRVAFPLSGGAQNVSPAMPVNMPPMPVTGTPPCVPSNVYNVNSIDCLQETQLDSESTLNEVKAALIEVLEKCPELGPKHVDIKRRIDVMEEMWQSNKLNNTIYAHMKELAFALKDQPKKADDIHRTLMIDHVGAVGTWMPGVKQLIHHCIAKTELISIDNDSKE